MDHVREMVDWTRRRKIVVAGLVAATLIVGILIGTVISGRVSAMKALSFAERMRRRWRCRIPFRRPVRLTRLSRG